MGGGPQQQGDEGGRIVLVVTLVAEQLLELVDQDQEPGARGQRLDAQAPVERAAAAAQVLLQVRDGRRDGLVRVGSLGGRGVLGAIGRLVALHGPAPGRRPGRPAGLPGGLAPLGVLDQRRRQPPEGLIPGAQLGHRPAGTGGAHEAAVQGRKQAGTDQGGLAGAGGAEHGQEVGLVQLVEELIHLILAAEKEVILVPPKRAQARIGAARSRAVRPSAHPASSATNARRQSSAQSASTGKTCMPGGRKVRGLEVSGTVPGAGASFLSGAWRCDAGTP